MIDTASFSTFGSSSNSQSFSSNAQPLSDGHGNNPTELAAMAKMKRQEADTLAAQAAAARGGLNLVA